MKPTKTIYLKVTFKDNQSDESASFIANDIAKAIIDMDDCADVSYLDKVEVLDSSRVIER